MSDGPIVLRVPSHNFEWYAQIRCPSCGLEAWIDRDQFEGRVIDCPNDRCSHHETYDLGKEKEGADGKS